jgi:hypothetical protein
MTEDLTNIGFGSIPSPEDYRDIAFASVVEPVPLPSKFFVDTAGLPVWHQRKIGACVGHAGGKYKQKLDQIDTKQVIPLSPRYLYGMAKAMDKVPGEGTYPRLVMKVLYDYGCTTEDELPNDTTLDHESYVLQRKLENFSKYHTTAAKYKISSYANVNIKSLDEIKQATIAGNGMTTLVRIGKEWYSDATGITWDKKRILPIKPPANIISGHQIYLIGYEDEGGDTKIHFLNSWSDEWADAGKGWFWWSQYKDFFVEAYTAVDIPQSLLDQAHNLPDPQKFTYNFARQMSFGDSTIDVKNLQKALQIDGEFPKDLPPTSYYGPITAKAVLAFQKKYNVASLTEIVFLRGRRVGPKTLGQLNKLFNK